MDDQWLNGPSSKAPADGTPPEPTSRTSRTPMALKLGLVGAGVVAGAVVAGTMTAGAATTGTMPASESAAGGYAGYGMPGPGGPRGEHGDHDEGTVKSVTATSITITVDGTDKTYAVGTGTKVFKEGVTSATLSDVKAGDTVHFHTSTDGKTITELRDGKGPGGPRGMFRGTSGTVKAVSATSITVTVDGTDKTYAVNADTKVFKEGVTSAKLSDVKAGDTVHLRTSTDGKTVTFLADGKGPAGGPGRMFANSSSGTVKSVTASSITITVNGSDKTYAVTSDSKIFKDGPAKLSDVKAGDTVRFATSADGKTLTFLLDGKPPAGVGGPRGFGHGPAGYGGPNGYGAPPA